MYTLTATRPNTIGEFYRNSFESYGDLEEFLEKRIRFLAKENWLATSRLENSVELVNDNYADVIYLEWRKAK